MKILVTGAGGFIGGYTARKLKEMGHEIIVNDFLEKLNDYSFDEYTVAGFDFSEYSNFKVLPKDIDIIFHIGAQSAGYIGLVNPEKDVHWNTIGTLNICRFAKETGVKKVIYTSSMSVYGNGDSLDENSIINPLSNYGISKYTGELYLKQFKNYGVDYTIFRLFNVYGPGQDMKNLKQGMASIFLAQALESKNIQVTGSLERYRDFVHVEDVFNALKLAIDGLSEEIVNVCYGKKTTVKDLLDIIFEVHDDPTDSFNVENIGAYDGDQFGTIGINNKLKSFGWDTKYDIKSGMKDFYEKLKGEF